jgi:hypothetical protein
MVYRGKSPTEARIYVYTYLHIYKYYTFIHVNIQPYTIKGTIHSNINLKIILIVGMVYRTKSPTEAYIYIYIYMYIHIYV